MTLKELRKLVYYYLLEMVTEPGMGASDQTLAEVAAFEHGGKLRESRTYKEAVSYVLQTHMVNDHAERHALFGQALEEFLER